ncbi:hypothetical protein BC826DRAFT_482261 [Russula brevipes]|nr:hypothetical protein BC826DRAFT_482261 [Russula brevipes]
MNQYLWSMTGHCELMGSMREVGVVPPLEAFSNGISAHRDGTTEDRAEFWHWWYTTREFRPYSCFKSILFLLETGPESGIIGRSCVDRIHVVLAVGVFPGNRSRGMRNDGACGRRCRRGPFNRGWALPWVFACGLASTVMSTHNHTWIPWERGIFLEL